MSKEPEDDELDFVQFRHNDEIHIYTEEDECEYCGDQIHAVVKIDQMEGVIYVRVCQEHLQQAEETQMINEVMIV